MINSKFNKLNNSRIYQTNINNLNNNLNSNTNSLHNPQSSTNLHQCLGLNMPNRNRNKEISLMKIVMMMMQYLKRIKTLY